MTSFLRYRIQFSLLLLLVGVLTAPLHPFIDWLPWSVIALCCVIAIFACAARHWFDLGLASLVAIVFVLVRRLFPHLDAPTLTLRTSAILAYVLLHGVLLIGPWSRVFPRVRSWYTHRRHLGVTVFLLSCLHANLVITLFFNRDILQAWQAVFTFFGSLALLILTVMAATSWDWAQKHISWKTWNVIHAALFIVFLIELSIVRGVWSRVGEIPGWTTTAFIVFVIFWIAVAPWGWAEVYPVY